MKILSLYDGMACGMIAMQNAGVQVDKYVAYEIDKYAIKTATHNFPIIEEYGDVFDADFTQYQDFDWLIGGSPCFAKGHFVLTKGGYKDISEVKIGDMVLTHKNRFMPVTHLYEHPAKTVSLKIQGYPEFITTENHPFYTINRSKNNYSEYKKSHSWRKFSKQPTWTKVSDMTTDTFCGHHIHIPLGENQYNLTEEESYILGRYVADGHIRHDKRKERKDSYQYQLILSVGSNKLNDFMNNVSENHCSCYSHTQSVYRCVFSSKRLVEIAEKFGKGAANKEIPEFVFNLPDNLIGKFIDGYMSGDGCYIESQKEYLASTISCKLAFGMQRLISSYFRTNVGISRSENDRVSMIGDRQIKGNYPLYTLCFKQGIRKQSVAHIQNDIIWTNVRSVKETGKIETVYNIEVAEDHSYTVNNCIVHNCTYWSIAQKNNRETEASGLGWDLFCQYVRALHEVKPKYFIYENNKSMSKAIRDSIRETFGFEEICINSALVSAQNRQRYYWVGKRNKDGTYSKVNVQQPKDRGILLKDVLDGVTDREKGRAVIGSIGRTTTREYFKKQQGSMSFEPVCMRYERTEEAKACIKAYEAHEIHHGFHELSELHPRTDGKTNTLSTVLKDNPICEPIRVGCMPSPDGTIKNSQGMRVYSIDGKSVAQQALSGGMGAKTGLYAIPCEWNESNIPIKAKSLADNKEYTVYEVIGGQITIKSKQYPIKLADGYYIIRKLTVNECKRLQTVPEWYEFPVSDSQAYKMLGNGWTCDVITHLIKSCLK